MKVLVACESSGRVREAFTKKGHYALSCDLKPSEIPGNHYQGDIKGVLYDDWDLIIAHPPCDYLANSGVRWLIKGDVERRRARWIDLSYARKFFHMFYDHPFCKKIVIENPIPHKHALLPKYTQLIQPWQFGHKEMKATCLWLKGVPKLKFTDIVGPPPKDKKERYDWQKVWTAPPGPLRKENRSRTYLGIAEAMAEQWSNIVPEPTLF
jgi:hypothetical protein